MTRLFIIDQSLKNAGGHHFDYAKSIADSASKQGYRPIVASNRKFDAALWAQEYSKPLAREEVAGGNVASDDVASDDVASDDVASDDVTLDPVDIYPVFRNTTYQKDSYLAGLQSMTRSRTAKALEDVSKAGFVDRAKHSAKHFLHHRRRKWFARQFAADCEKFFGQYQLQSGDHAFFTTVSELELLGLAAYLASNRSTTNLQWHLQFHFNLFEGRPDEYASQGDVAKAISGSLSASLKQLVYHSVSFYTTSSALADQYNTLGVADFEPLPYPIADEFRNGAVLRRTSPSCVPLKVVSADSGSSASAGNTSGQMANVDFDNSMSTSNENGLEIWNSGASTDSSGSAGPVGRRRLRMTCPGGIRREKGQQDYLQKLVDQIWSTHLESGQIELLVQRPKPKWSSAIQKINLVTPKTPPLEDADADSQPIQYAEHPLPRNEYVDLIRSTDIGLLFYDSRTYFSRRAGILGELLACGTPVIVSAGCWLANQIAESTFSYVDRVVSENLIGRRLCLEQLSWQPDNVPLPGGVVSFDRDRHPFNFSIDVKNEERAMAIEFDWHWPKSSGSYCLLEIDLMDAAGRVVSSERRMVGVRNRSRGRKTNALFNLAAGVASISVRIKNGYGVASASIRDLAVTTIQGQQGDPFPVAAVGLTAIDVEDLASSVDEMVTHYDHYRRTAAAFSRVWSSNHDPALAVDYLVNSNQTFSKVI